MTSLSDVYDADKAQTDLGIAAWRVALFIPHPLVGVGYADGSVEDTTAGHVCCTACRIGRPCKTKRKRTV